MKFRIVAVLASFLGLGACAQQHISYQSPRVMDFPKNSALLDQGFDKTWDNLIKNLSQKYFVINNVSKDSRILNVSFSAEDPSKYIECGTTTRSHYVGRNVSISYEVAAPLVHYQIALPKGALIAHVYNVTRTTSLEGRTNVYVAPRGDKTEVSVNTRYIFQVTSQATNIQGYSLPASKGPAITFNTTDVGKGQPEETSLGVQQVSCASNGKIERDIIDAARAN